MGDLNSRRGRIAGMDTRGASTIIRAQVPMAEMLTYEQHLTSATGGRGAYSDDLLALRRGAVTPTGEDRRDGEGTERAGHEVEAESARATPVAETTPESTPRRRISAGARDATRAAGVPSAEARDAWRDAGVPSALARATRTWEEGSCSPGTRTAKRAPNARPHC